MGPRLVALGALLARRYGREAVMALAVAARAWLADPDNDARRRELVDQLRGWAARAGDRAGRSAARLAREVERRRASVGAWERELVGLRHEIARIEAGPVRAAALGAYVAQLSAGRTLIAAAERPERARRRVMAVLAAEERMLGRGQLGPDGDEALAGVRDAREACYAAAAERATTR